MSDLKDGGPAFPNQPFERTFDHPKWANGCGGMSLRDYFAAKAMAAQIERIGPEDKVSNVLAAVSFAYAVADAMLAERSK